MSKQSKNKKKLGYDQYEKLLALAHQKSEILAQRVQALQSYVISYIEYRNHDVTFNEWINKRIIQEQEELKKKEEQANEKV